MPIQVTLAIAYVLITWTVGIIIAGFNADKNATLLQHFSVDTDNDNPGFGGLVFCAIASLFWPLVIPAAIIAAPYFLFNGLFKAARWLSFEIRNPKENV